MQTNILRRMQAAGLGACGRLSIIIGVIIAVPLIVLPFYPSELKYALAFLFPAIAAVVIGVVMKIAFGRSDQDFHNSSLIVMYAWFFGFAAGAIPFAQAGGMDFLHALFESVSGGTGTGLSVMDIDAAPKIIIFFRAFLQFCGGLGFVMVMLMFTHQKHPNQLYAAEGHFDKLKPSLKKTSQSIALMYLLIMLAGALAYAIAGMPIFEAIAHSMAAISTGGFSSFNASIGAYNSAVIEAITIALMIAGMTNFAVWVLAEKRKFRTIAKVSEIRLGFIFLAIAVPAVAISLLAYGIGSIGESVRLAVFNVVSALSTSGFATAEFSGWPQFSIGILIVLMLIGGGLGSTAGGIKLARIEILIKIVRQNFRKKFDSAILAARKSKPELKALSYFKPSGKSAIGQRTISNTVGFVSVYLAIFIIGSLAITASANAQIGDAMFEFASSLGTVGLTSGITGPHTNSPTLIIEMLGMMLGRLEIFIVFTSIASVIHVHKS